MENEKDQVDLFAESTTFLHQTTGGYGLLRCWADKNPRPHVTKAERERLPTPKYLHWPPLPLRTMNGHISSLFGHPIEQRTKYIDGEWTVVDDEVGDISWVPGRWLLLVIDVDKGDPQAVVRQGQFKPLAIYRSSADGGSHIVVAVKDKETAIALGQPKWTFTAPDGTITAGDIRCAQGYARVPSHDPETANRIARMILWRNSDGFDESYCIDQSTLDRLGAIKDQEPSPEEKKHRQERKQARIDAGVAPIDTADEADRIADYYGMTPDGDGTYRGPCPVCNDPRNDAFVVTAGDERVILKCWACDLTSDQKIELIQTAIPKTASKSFDDDDDGMMLVFGNKKGSMILGTKLVKVEDHESLKRFNEAIERCQDSETQTAIRKIGEAMGRKKPNEQFALSVLNTRLRLLGNKNDLPDYSAQHEVDMMIQACQSLGIDQAELDKADINYKTIWRGSNVVKMRNGDFPLAHTFCQHGGYATAKDAEDAFKEAGGVIIKGGINSRSSDGMMAAVRATGVKIVWSELDTGLMLEHPDIKEFKNTVKVEPPEFTPLLQLQKGIVRAIGTLGYTTQSEVDDEGEEKVDGNGKPIRTTTWHINQFMKQESGAKGFASIIYAQIGTEIPRVDYSAELTRSLLNKIDNMSQPEKGDCVHLAKTWLNQIPYIRPINAGLYPELLELASMLPYVVFAKRRLQFMPSHEGGYYSQRTMLVFGGIRRAGKTTLARYLFPQDGVFKNRISSDFTFSKDENDMKRRVNGRLLAICDEMSGISSTPANTSKAFITWASGEYHKKFKNYSEMVRSDVLVGTTNNSNDIPSDPALQDRIMLVNLEAAPGYSDKERHDGIVKWMNDHHEKLMIGGMILAQQDVDLNPSEIVDTQRSKASIDLNKSNSLYIGTIKDMVWNGIFSMESPKKGPIISIVDICLHAGLLKYQRDVQSTAISRAVRDGATSDHTAQQGRLLGVSASDLDAHKRGDLIRPTDGKSPDFVWSQEVQDAFKVLCSNSSGKITQIKQAIATLHGDDEKSGIKRMMEPRSVESWKKSRSRFDGFAPLDGRMAEEWNIRSEGGDE